MSATLAALLEIATATDPGRLRSHNEDALAADAALGLAVLADGMGGHAAGEVASSIAVATFVAEMRRRLATHALDASGVSLAVKLVRESSAAANAAIRAAANREPRYAGMGTTLLAVLFYDQRVTVGHAGDSRLYRLRGDRFEQITRDHSLLQQLIDAGVITPAQARYSLHRNVVMRALGVDPEVQLEVHTFEVERGDIYLLCSDGLSDMMPDESIHETLGRVRADLPLAARRLVQVANGCGGRDNISVVLVRVRDGLSEPA